MRRLLLNCAAAAALVMNAAPVVAVPAATATAAAQSRVLPISIEVARFYQTPANGPIWFRGGTVSPAAAELVGTLRRAPLDGLSSGPQIAEQVEAAIARARSGNPAAVGQAERLLSLAWVHYVQALKSPSAGI